MFKADGSELGAIRQFFQRAFKQNAQIIPPAVKDTVNIDFCAVIRYTIKNEVFSADEETFVAVSTADR